MTKTKEIFTLTDSEISLLEVTAKKNDAVWEYTKPGPWFKGGPCGQYYAHFLKKVHELREENKLQTAATLLCNAGYAIDLAVQGFITPAIAESTQVGLSGAGRGLTTILTIPKQDFLIEEQTISIKIVIVDCFSFGDFVLIDENDENL